VNLVLFEKPERPGAGIRRDALMPFSLEELAYRHQGFFLIVDDQNGVS
jgi:hypothetical protein